MTQDETCKTNVRNCSVTNIIDTGHNAMLKAGMLPGRHCCEYCPGGRFKNTEGLLNRRALKFSPANKIYIFQCMGKIFCVEFQRYPLKFHTKYLAHTLKDMIFI